MAIDPDTLAAARRRIQALPPSPRVQQVQLIASLLPEINSARERGLSLDAIIPVLREAGCTLSAKTIRNYVSQARRAGALAGTTTHEPPASSPTVVSTPTPRLGSREVVPTRPAKASAAASAELPGRFSIIPDTPDI